jgi:hypothetical protein
LFGFSRFKPLFERESFIIATSVHPRFKLISIPKEIKVLEMNVLKLLRCKLEELNDMVTGSKENSGDDPLDIPSRMSSVLNELDLFLVDQDKTLLSLKKISPYQRIIPSFQYRSSFQRASRKTFQCGAAYFDDSKKPPI